MLSRLTVFLAFVGFAIVSGCVEESAPPAPECSETQPCPIPNYACVNSRCVLQQCQNECLNSGDWQCTADRMSYQICANADADPCLEWTAPTACPQGTVCDQLNRRCTCSGECTPGQEEQQECQGSNVGECRPGVRKRICQPNCMWSQWEDKCTGAVGVTQEICDLNDNDCDSFTDEDLTKPCALACGAGTQTCANGQWSICQGAQQPKPEECNNVDDDCDGKTDNASGSNTDFSLTQSCQTTDCGQGNQKCDFGRWGKCDVAGRTCDYMGQFEVGACPGSNEYGVCAGTCKRTCGQGCQWGQWVTQSPGQPPSDEICDGLDNDCNNRVDDIDPSDVGWDQYEFSDRGANDTCPGCYYLGSEPNNMTILANELGQWGYDPDDWYCFDADDNFSLFVGERIILSLKDIGPAANLNLYLYREVPVENVTDTCQNLELVASSENSSNQAEQIEWSENLGDDDKGRYYVDVNWVSGDSCYTLTVHGLR